MLGLIFSKKCTEESSVKADAISFVPRRSPGVFYNGGERLRIVIMRYPTETGYPCRDIAGSSTSAHGRFRFETDKTRKNLSKINDKMSKLKDN